MAGKVDHVEVYDLRGMLLGRVNVGVGGVVELGRMAGRGPVVVRVR
jgi:hypothetical protein